MNWRDWQLCPLSSLLLFLNNNTMRVRATRAWNPTNCLRKDSCRGAIGWKVVIITNETWQVKSYFIILTGGDLHNPGNGSRKSRGAKSAPVHALAYTMNLRYGGTIRWSHKFARFLARKTREANFEAEIGARINSLFFNLLRHPMSLFDEALINANSFAWKRSWIGVWKDKNCWIKVNAKV